MTSLSELQYELEAAKEQKSELRAFHLNEAKVHAYQAWKALNGKQHYRSHGLNFMLMILNHNPPGLFSDETVQMLIDLTREIEHAHIDKDLMKAYTQLATQQGLALGAY